PRDSATCTVAMPPTPRCSYTMYEPNSCGAVTLTIVADPHHAWASVPGWEFCVHVGLRAEHRVTAVTAAHDLSTCRGGGRNIIRAARLHQADELFVERFVHLLERCDVLGILRQLVRAALH